MKLMLVNVLSARTWEEHVIAGNNYELEHQSPELHHTMSDGSLLPTAFTPNCI